MRTSVLLLSLALVLVGVAGSAVAPVCVNAGATLFLLLTSDPLDLILDYDTVLDTLLECPG